MTDSAWAELGGLLAKGDAGAVEAVRRFRDDPTGYFASQPDGSWASDIGPSGWSDWLALVSWLVDKELAFVMDWNDEAGDYIDWVESLAGDAPVAEGLRNVKEEFGQGFLEAAPAVEEVLAPWGLVPLVLDIDADSCPIVVVKQGDVKRIVELAEALGHEAYPVSQAADED
jgi:hypothetical protein